MIGSTLGGPLHKMWDIFSYKLISFEDKPSVQHLNLIMDCPLRSSESIANTKNLIRIFIAFQSLNSVAEESSVSEDVHHWCLTTDPVRNATVREEFSFEHSPNASLCLAIFNLLPASPSYTR